jgi:hypothetical protein
MASQAQIARFYPAVSASKVLVKAGETKIPGDSIGGVESVVQSVGVLYGWIIAESTGSAVAKIRLYDGASATEAGYLGTITLGENESNREFFPVASPTLKNNALYIEIVSGKVEGVVFYG